VAAIVLLKNSPSPGGNGPKPPPGSGGNSVESQANKYKLVINVQGADNAEIILANGEKKKLPYETMGANGEIVEGTIRANGFVETHIRPVISHRKSVYTYELAKITK
jgi:hypothetical protein